MFYSARIKLTSWYLAIIMLISLLFSLVIYVGINNELKRFEYFARRRLELEEGFFLPPFPRHLAGPDLEMIAESRRRLIFVLFLINSGILVISGLAAYFLAGKTLAPIKEMVDEQNRFITDASHELRTPLTSLRSEIEVNLRNKKLSLYDAKTLLKSNLEEVVSLQSLSDHLMELTSYQKKNGTLAFEKISLREIIDSAYKKIAPLAALKNISINNQVTDYSIIGNNPSLTELFIILLDNAIKYSPKNTSVTLTSKKEDHRLAVAVIDEGMGIDQKDIPNIFDRFYRSDKSRSKKTVDGYGLGLAIAKKIIDLHNGHINVKSKPDWGSVFTVLLPQKQPKSLI